MSGARIMRREKTQQVIKMEGPVKAFICGVSTYNSEKAMAPHSSTLAWKIPWTEEPVRLRSMGSLRVGHN